MSGKANNGGGVVALRPRRKPGPKPGSRHSGMFTSNDPRRWMHGPIKKELKSTVEELFREGAEQARDFLFELLADPKASSRDRYAAACEVLNRGFGKPVDRQVVATLEGNNNGKDTSNLSGKELDNLISQALLSHEVSDGEVLEGQVVDITDNAGPSSSPTLGIDDED